jgi:predicted adenine nucleotide alpha hydrolase (AANH) superfamily ATPase
MKNKIVAISILMLMMCAMAASVFAEQPTEYEYKVTVYYKTSNGNKPIEYTIWAASAREAEDKAVELCKYDKGETVSCGGARTTGKSR